MKKIILGIGLFCLFGSFVMFTDKNTEATIEYLVIGIICLLLCKGYIYELYKINFSKEVRLAKKTKRISDIEKLKTEMLIKINSQINSDIEQVKRSVGAFIQVNNSNSNNNSISNINKNDFDTIINLIDEKRFDSIERDGMLRKKIDKHLVQIFAYCPEHKIFNKKIFNDDVFTNKKDNHYPLLSEAIKMGLLNQGCQCTIATYYEPITEKEAKQNDLWLKKRGITITSYGVSGDNPYANAVPHQVYANAYIDRKQSNPVKDYVVFDTETTGLEPEIDKIIEISAIKYINNEKVEEFSCLVNPKCDFDPYITTLTGIRKQDLMGKPTIDKVLPTFYEFIEDYTLVAHNAPYDIKMLACEAYRNNIPLCNNKIIDTIPLTKRIISRDKIENYKLETLKNYLGLQFKSHRALNDCETCAKIYQLYLASTQKKKIIMIDDETGEVLEEIN